MKKISLLLLISSLSLLLVAGTASAINFGKKEVSGAAGEAGYGVATETTFAETVGIIIQIALSFVGAIFLGLMVYAGYLWMTARGEEEQIKKAQKIILASIIGLVITIAAYSITTYVVPNIVASSSESAVGQY